MGWFPAHSRCTLPAPKVYSPRLRRDQLEALFDLERFAGRPMTALAQEAVDRFLDEHGGVAGLIERGLAAFGDPGEDGLHIQLLSSARGTAGRRIGT